MRTRCVHCVVSDSSLLTQHPDTWVVKLDPSSHQGGENSLDEEIRRTYLRYHPGTMHQQSFTGLREKYTTSGEMIAVIDVAIDEIFNLCPLVLIDIATARLPVCDACE